MRYPKGLLNEVKQALHEDLGSGDITAALLPEDKTATATIISREAGVLCGQAWVDCVFKQINASTDIVWHVAEGSQIKANTVLCTITGNARSLLTAERPALNFLQTFSATASATAQYVQQLKGTKARLLDTRKTLPGLRYGQKHAVSVGGGYNHRMGLFDAYLIKENHILAAGSIANAVKKARALQPGKLLEVEVETIAELNQALAAKVDRIMLDNFSLAKIREAIQLTQGNIPLEVSGNVDLNNIREYAETGVDYISVGAITKHIQALDLSMRIKDDN